MSDTDDMRLLSCPHVMSVSLGRLLLDSWLMLFLDAGFFYLLSDCLGGRAALIRITKVGKRTESKYSTFSFYLALRLNHVHSHGW